VFVWSQLPESCQEMGSRAFSQKLLEEGGVAVCPGAAFDAQADAFVRFALVEPEARIRKALKSIENVIS